MPCAEKAFEQIVCVKQNNDMLPRNNLSDVTVSELISALQVVRQGHAPKHIIIKPYMLWRHTPHTQDALCTCTHTH